MWRIIFFSIVTVVSSTGATFGQVRLQSTMVDAKYTGKLREDSLLKFEPAAGVSPIRKLFTGSGLHYTTGPSLGGKADRGPWKFNIVTTIFWIGERPTTNNPVPNSRSSWDPEWALRYGGYDDPEPAARRDFRPVNFVPRQNPFYIALPYNDVEGGHTKLEAPAVIPWFRTTFVCDGHSTLKGHWIAIRHGDRVCYAQWEDCGPFRTDHWQYVFGDDRPRPNLNRGAGLDVSPSVRDYLGLRDIDVCDWKFVELREVPSGPWAFYGDNNPFVIARRQSADRFARK